jgi:hypothetical protein
MSKVYVVTDGDYSDYSIKGICSTPEKAKQIKKLFKAYNNIEIYTLDEYDPIVEESHGKKFYFVALAIEDGSVLEVKEGTYRLFNGSSTYEKPTQYWTTPNRFNVEVIVSYLFATNETHAIKITNEKRIAYKLERNL